MHNISLRSKSKAEWSGEFFCKHYSFSSIINPSVSASIIEMDTQYKVVDY